MALPTLQPPPEIKDFKLKSITEIELEKLIEKRFKGLKINVLEDNKINALEENDVIADEINRFQARARQSKFYYNRPSPVDILHEEDDFLIA